MFRSGSIYILHISQAFWCTGATFTITKLHSSYVLNVSNMYVFLDRQRRHIQCDCIRPRGRKSDRPDSGEQLPNCWAPKWCTLHPGPTCAGSAGHHQRPSWPLTFVRCWWQLVPILVWFHSWKFSTLWFFIVSVSMRALPTLEEKSLPILLNLFDVLCHFTLEGLEASKDHKRNKITSCHVHSFILKNKVNLYKKLKSTTVEWMDDFGKNMNSDHLWFFSHVGEKWSYWAYMRDAEYFCCLWRQHWKRHKVSPITKATPGPRASVNVLLPSSRDCPVTPLVTPGSYEWGQKNASS